MIRLSFYVIPAVRAVASDDNPEVHAHQYQPWLSEPYYVEAVPAIGDQVTVLHPVGREPYEGKVRELKWEFAKLIGADDRASVRVMAVVS